MKTALNSLKTTKKVTLLIFLFSSLTSLAQEKFLIGKWKTSPTNTTQVITSSYFTNDKIFKINSIPLDDSDVALYLYPQNSSSGIKYKSAEGAGAYIESKTLYIQQNNNNTLMGGFWEVINDNRISTNILQWSFQHRFNLVIGSFKKDTEFVLEINNDVGCSNLGIYIKVDNTIVKSLGSQQQVFLPGSSFYGKGKKIEIVGISGSCQKLKFLTGRLKIYRAN